MCINNYTLHIVALPLTLRMCPLSAFSLYIVSFSLSLLGFFVPYFDIVLTIHKEARTSAHTRLRHTYHRSPEYGQHVVPFRKMNVLEEYFKNDHRSIGRSQKLIVMLA